MTYDNRKISKILLKDIQGIEFDTDTEIISPYQQFLKLCKDNIHQMNIIHDNNISEKVKTYVDDFLDKFAQALLQGWKDFLKDKKISIMWNIAEELKFYLPTLREFCEKKLPSIYRSIITPEIADINKNTPQRECKSTVTVRTPHSSKTNNFNHPIEADDDKIGKALAQIHRFLF